MYSQAYRGAGGAHGASGNLQLDESQALGLLQHLNKEELQQLMDDEVKMVELIQDLSQVKNISTEKDTLLASNKSVAEYNLQREPRLAQARQQLARVYQQAVDIQKHFDTNKQKLDYSASQLSTDTALAVLQTEAAKSEEESEGLAEKFLDGDVEVEDFVDQYLQKRTVAHTRRVKVEKMQELLQNKNLRPAPPPPAPKPVPSSTQSSFVGNHNSGMPPYPGGGGTSFGAAPYPNYSAMPSPSSYLPR